MQRACRLFPVAIRQQNSIVEQAATSTQHWSPLANCVPCTADSAVYHTCPALLSSDNRRRGRQLSDDDGWERLVAFHRREVLDKPRSGKLAPPSSESVQDYRQAVKDGRQSAHEDDPAVDVSDVSFSELVAVAEGRLPGYCAPVFPSEAHVSPNPKGRLTSTSFNSIKLLILPRSRCVHTRYVHLLSHHHHTSQSTQAHACPCLRDSNLSIDAYAFSQAVLVCCGSPPSSD